MTDERYIATAIVRTGDANPSEWHIYVLSFANNRSGHKVPCCNAFITMVDTVVENWCR